VKIKQQLLARTKPVFHRLQKAAPELYFFVQYYRAARKLGNMAAQRDRVLKQLIDGSKQKKCLQVGVKEGYGAKFGPNWTSVDLYDKRDFIDFNYDIHDLKFADEEFDVAVCTSILEHVKYPERAIKELHRVLKPGGEVWVQLPFCFPYHGEPNDFWRASPAGLRIWMKEFEEKLCGAFLFTRTALAVSTFFYGVKPLKHVQATRADSA
jgi:SAM-dependent methyltransferase